MSFESTPLKRILGNVEGIRRLVVNFKEWHCDCGNKSFEVKYEPHYFICMGCNQISSIAELRKKV